LKTDLGVLDILTEVRPLGGFDRVKRESVTVRLFERPCQVISIEDLIEVKKTMSRPKDRITLAELLEIQQRKGQ